MVITNQEEFWRFYKTSFIELENNKKENFLLYKIEKTLLKPKKLKGVVNGHYLLGVKNNKVYRLAIQNYIEGEIINIGEFLSGIYVSN